MGHYSDIAGQINDMDTACTQIEQQLKGVRAHTDLDVMQKIGANHNEIVHGDGWLKVEGPQLAKVIVGPTTTIYVGGKGEFIAPASVTGILIGEYKRILGVTNSHILGHKYERIGGAKIDRLNGLKLEQKSSEAKETGVTGKVQDDPKGINQVGKWGERSTLQKYDVKGVKEYKDQVEEEAAQFEADIKSLEEEIKKWKQECARFKGTITKYEHKGSDHKINASSSITVRGDTLTVKGSGADICVDQAKLTASGSYIQCKGGIEVSVDGITRVGQ